MKQPLACDRSLDSFDAAQHERHNTLAQHMENAAISVAAVTDGLAVHYPTDADTIVKLAEFITLERLCCPFFDFDLRVSAGADTVELRLTGPPDVQQLLHAEVQSRSHATNNTATVATSSTDTDAADGRSTSR